MLKTASANHRGRATIEMYNAPKGFVEFVRQASGDHDFQIRCRDGGTLMVDNLAPGAEAWTTGPFLNQVDQVQAVAKAAGELRDWWLERVAGIDWPS